jgi:hypothetical protein
MRDRTCFCDKTDGNGAVRTCPLRQVSPSQMGFLGTCVIPAFGDLGDLCVWHGHLAVVNDLMEWKRWWRSLSFIAPC